MKFKKTLLIIILAAITFLSVNFLIGASQITVFGYGKAYVICYPNGNLGYGCDNSDPIHCTIIIDEE